MREGDSAMRELISRLLTRYWISTVVVTLLLLLFANSLHLLADFGIIPHNFAMLQIMSFTTAAFTFWGSVINAFQKEYLALFLGVVAFLILTVCLFYSKEWYEYVTVGVCLTITTWRISLIVN